MTVPTNIRPKITKQLLMSPARQSLKNIAAVNVYNLIVIKTPAVWTVPGKLTLLYPWTKLPGFTGEGWKVKTEGFCGVFQMCTEPTSPFTSFKYILYMQKDYKMTSILCFDNECHDNTLLKLRSLVINLLFC